MNGEAVGPDFTAYPLADYISGQVSVAGLDQGKFVVASLGSDANANGILARIFDFNNSAIGNAFYLNSTYINDQMFPRIAVRNSGGFVVAFSDESPFDNGNNFPRRFRARAYSTIPLYSNLTHSLSVLSNDQDPEYDPLTITAVDGTAISAGAPIALPSGSVVALDDGALEYDPTAAPFAIALPDGDTGDDSFTYTISDGALTDTANVTVTLTGVNDAPTADADALSVGEDDGAADITATLLDGDTDPDTGETALLAISGVDTTGTQGLVAFNAGAVTYSPNGAFESLALGQAGSDAFSYTIIDPGGLTATATVSVTVDGANDAPTAAADALTFAEEEGARDVTASLLANDTDPDAGETAQIAITAVDTTLTLGRVTLDGGIVSYDPDGVFNALTQGQTATDRFDYTISDPHGATETATATVTINGFNGYTLSVASSGLGAGIITSAPVGLNCGGGGSCEAFFTQNSQVSLSRFVAPESRFVGWGGDCESAGTGACIVTMNANRTVTARFELENPPDGRIVAATLPGARSGYVGGSDITVFMTVLSRATTPAQACRITAPNDPPFTFSYREIDAQSNVVGDPDPLFDLGNGGAINFVIALTPTAETGPGGDVFQPRIVCENAELAPIEGVNSVQVSIGAAPVPDILSIGATASGDGVVRIPGSGNRISFLSAAALNIGAGDGSAGAGQATVTASVDTGAAVLPVTLEVCETASTGGCITPRGVDSVTAVFDPNAVKFFAVFVRANEGADIPFDPANARVFLRFADAGGVTRSATSAALSSPLPSDQPVAVIPAGRWSVLVRQDSGEWPSLRRASLFVFEDGATLLDDGESVTSLSFEGFATVRDYTRFALSGIQGAANDNAIHAGDALGDQPGALWGVRDARSDLETSWAEIAGSYGPLRVAADGAISGIVEGCIVNGAPGTGDHPPGVLMAELQLFACDRSGTYRAVVDVPANDFGRPALLIGGPTGGWRLDQSR